MRNGIDSNIGQIDKLICKSKSVESIKIKFRLITNNDELWNIVVFITVFITILITSKLGIYEIDDNIVYSFSLSSLILSISQVTKGIKSKIFYLFGNIVMIIGVNLNVEVINYMKSIIDDKTLLILSMLVIFIGALINKFDKIQREKKISERNRKINELIDNIEEVYTQHKKGFKSKIDELGILLEIQDKDFQEKIDRRNEIIDEVKSDKIFENYINHTKKLINDELIK